MHDARPSANLPAGAPWDRDQFRREFELHNRAVYAVSCRICGPELAAEVTQEVFLRLWERPMQFDPDRGSLRTFLLTMAHGVTIDRIRSERARRARETRVSRRPSTAPVDIEHRVLIQDRRAQVAQALEALSHVERQAIIATFYGGLTYREAATALGVPEGTFKSRIRRAMQHLRAALAEPDLAANAEPTHCVRPS